MGCESCGADDNDLTPVHRKYLASGDHAPDRGELVVHDVERWCVSCLTQYPHEPVGA